MSAPHPIGLPGLDRVVSPDHWRDTVQGSRGLVAHYTRRVDAVLRDELGSRSAALSGGYADGPLLVRGAGRSIDVDGLTGTHAEVAALAAFAWVHQTWVFSVDIWVEWGGLNSDTIDVLVGNGTSAVHRGFFVGIDDRASLGFSNRLRAQLYRGQSGVITALEAPDDSITAGVHHVVLTCDAITARLYIDGAEVASAAAIATVAGDATHPLRLGGVGGADLPLDGRGDAWTIRAAHMSADEVLWRYRRGL